MYRQPRNPNGQKLKKINRRNLCNSELIDSSFSFPKHHQCVKQSVTPTKLDKVQIIALAADVADINVRAFKAVFGRRGKIRRVFV